MMPVFRFPFGRNNYMYPMHFYNSHPPYGLNPGFSYYNNINSYTKKQKTDNDETNIQFQDLNRTQKKSHSENAKINDENIKNTEENRGKNHSSNIKEKKEDSYFFDIFGIRLYFDDILLISLIFFLYKEDVHDEELFFSLILLLLT